MVKYVIYEAEDDEGPEHGMTSQEQWDSNPILRASVSGKPMKIVKQFEAETWEAAMQVYNNHYDYGEYVLMKG